MEQNAIEQQLAYQELFKTEIKETDLKKIRDNAHKGWMLGSEKFQATIELLSKRQAVSKGSGGPSKVEEKEGK